VATAGSDDDAELAHENAEFFEMSLDHLCVAGFDGYWKRLNPSWTRTLGWTAEELMSRPLIDFVHPDDRAETLAAREALTHGQPLLGLANRYRCKDGTYRWFEWRSISHVDRGLVYATARDVTALREMQQQLILADRMASVGMLAAGVAHEINNPLAYVIANLDMLVEEIRPLDAGPFSAHVTDWIQLLRESRQGAERIRKIVRELKTFSRAEAERRSVIDVQPVIELSINMAFNEVRHRARLVKDYGATPAVEADDSRLGQVFINLLVNAAQAIPEGDVEGNEVRIVTGTDEVGNALIEIRDTGPGIPEGVVARIFDPFFTTKPVGLGTGLGLSICHSIVTSMGGTITAENGPLRGAVFRVILPATRRNATTSSLEPPMQAARTRRARVLIIDDERSVGDSMQRALREHDVTTTTSAREALELIPTRGPFDVIFSDLMMPEMSGVDLYEELAKRDPGAADRMVFMTGGAFTPGTHQLLDRIANERIEKPFDVRKVRDIVDRLAKRS
jgi:PAS domain S-box-containing protein